MLSHTLPFAPLPAWLHWLFQHGGAGVDVFFILSGLVIVQSLDSFGYRPRPFLIARVARIYPVFLVVFAFAWRCSRWPRGSSGWRGSVRTVRHALPLVGRLASDWAVGIATHLTMTHGLFPDGVLPRSCGWDSSVPLEPVHRVAVLSAGAADRRAPGAAVVWLAVPGDIGRGRSSGRRWCRRRGSSAARSCRTRRSTSRSVWSVPSWCGRGPRASEPIWRCSPATLALCALQGGVDKLLPPVVWTACLAAQLHRLACRRDGNEAAAGVGTGAAGGNVAIPAVGLAGCGLLLHLPGQRAGAEAAGRDACACWCTGMRRCSPRSGCRGAGCCRSSRRGGCTTGSKRRHSAVAACWHDAACAALAAQRRMKVQ